MCHSKEVKKNAILLHMLRGTYKERRNKKSLLLQNTKSFAILYSCFADKSAGEEGDICTKPDKRKTCRCENCNKIPRATKLLVYNTFLGKKI